MTEQSASLEPVYITTVTCATVAAVYGHAGVKPSAIPSLVLALGPLISVVLWLQNDARLRRFATVHDWGLLVYLLWPALVPWYLIKTRGFGAWRMALGLMGAVVAPLILLAVAAMWHVILVGRLH